MQKPVRTTIQKRDNHGIIRHGAEWLALWSDPDSVSTADERRADQAAKRAQIDAERRMAAAARALSGDPALQVGFGAAPESLELLRGEVDSLALRRRYHSPAMHDATAPVEPPLRKLFDLCEEVRCEALGARMFPGVERNLVARQQERLRLSGLLGAHLAALVPLAEALRMVLRDALLGRAAPSLDSGAFRMWDSWLRGRFSDQFDALIRTQDSQEAFAPIARGLIDQVCADVGRAERQPRFTPSADSGDDSSGETPRPDPAGTLVEPGGELFLKDVSRPAVIETSGNTEAPLPYATFTTAHDRIARPGDLVSPEALAEARAALDRRRATFRRDLARLVTKMQRRLMARQTRDWSFDLEEGLVDSARLDRVVVHPGFAHAFKMERVSEFRDTTVSILIDNSGSMRGKAIEIACVASDLIGTGLERSGISCEILGFTTGGWKGGQSARDWIRAGRPADPGRLNDLLHIIYKTASEPVRRSRNNLCAMLDPGILKENVDGEALLWATSRLLTRPESRKILIVISDGAPVDQATLENNSDKALLDRHLRQAIHAIESAGQIQLAAIGVRHDVEKYYQNCVRIEYIELLGASLVKLIDQSITA